MTQELSNVTMDLIADGSYHTELTTNMITTDFTLELRETQSQCEVTCRSPGTEQESNTPREDNFGPLTGK